MIKLKTENGHIAYLTSMSDLCRIDSLGICDECGKPSLVGYLVPVLNHYQCPHCFDEWRADAKFYPEDTPVEKRRAQYYESCIPLEKPFEERS